MAIGAHQAYKRLSHLRVCRILDVENSVQDSVNSQQCSRRGEQPVRNAHIHQAHYIAASAKHAVPFRHASYSSAGKKAEVVDPDRAAIVFSHQFGESRCQPALGGENQAPRIGDYFVGIIVRENTYIFNLNVFGGEDIPVRNDEIFAVSDIVDAGPSCQSCPAAENPVGSHKEGESKPQQRREGNGRSEN